MRHPKLAIVAIVGLSFLADPAVSIAGPSHDYSKLIRGCWLGSRKFEVYHADGRWGVKRNEEAPEDNQGRRWRVEGDKLILTYPGDHGPESAVYTIISCTERKLVLSIDGHTEEYDRYSADCQKEA
jgi:hypothetical protein